MPQEIRDWLARAGFAEHADAFIENAIDHDLLPHLTDEDLKTLGVVKLGDRKRLLLAIPRAHDGTNENGNSDQRPTYSATVEAEADRRLLTVLFCDLVGSTELSRQLDPEELREIIRRYQDAVAGAVTRYGGYIAKYLGDGVLAYFGWPQAYEDQAERAVRAGLDARAAVNGLHGVDGHALAARVGIATGQAVVGDIVGASGRDAEAVIGETPNLAARLQNAAVSGQVVIDGVSHRLVGDAFAVEDLGTPDLKGFDRTVRAWAVTGEVDGKSRFDLTKNAAPTHFLGRDAEVQLLRERWHLASQGEGQVVWISGEAGIGKSRLLEAFCDALAQDEHTSIRYQCSPYHTSSALYPTIQDLRRSAQFVPSDTDEMKLDKLEDWLRDTADDGSDFVPLFADLLSLPFKARYGALNQPPQQIKERLLETLTAQLIRLAEQRPILFLFEDLHWIDPTSQELLERQVSRLQKAPILLIGTHRPQWVPFGGYNHITSIHLNRLGNRQCERIVREIADDRCPAELIERIVARADGVPLFVEELIKTVVEADSSVADADIPASLQASLTERLDRLGGVKEIAQIGAVIGRTFSHDLLASLSSMAEAELQDAIERLTGAGIIYRDGALPTATYTFRHALIRDAAYDGLLRATRREHHMRVANLLEKHHPDVAENQPAVIAYHYSLCGDARLAAAASLRAARHAIDRSANAEAVTNAERGLQALRELPETPDRNDLELELQIALGSAMVATRGYADPTVETTYARARALCETAGNQEKLLLILRGQHVYEGSCGRMVEALRTAEAFADVAQKAGLQGFRIGAQHNLCQIRFLLGDPVAALAEGEKGIALYDGESQAIAGWAGGAPVVQCYVWSAAAAALIGDSNRSKEYADRGLDLSGNTGQDFSRVHCFALLCLQAVIRRDVSAAQELSGRAMAICAKYNIRQWGTWARMVHSWASAQVGEPNATISEFEAALTGYRELGVKLCEPFFLALFADILLRSGELVRGQQALDEAFEVSLKTAENWTQPELHRLKAQTISAGRGGLAADDAIKWLDKGFEIALGQGANLSALRCALDLYRVCASGDEDGASRHRLADIRSRLPDGFIAPELTETEAILGSTLKS